MQLQNNIIHLVTQTESITVIKSEMKVSRKHNAKLITASEIDYYKTNCIIILLCWIN